MVSQAEKRRVVDLEAGRAMVVTDLHGDWDAYRRYRDRFLQLQSRGEADCLFILGDLIHRTSLPNVDKSLEIVLDLLALRAELADRLVVLLGNHEVGHIYSIPIAKGKELYTPRFERIMGNHRADIVAFFDSLPFYIRTQAGVTLAHAGATSLISEKNARQRLFAFSHQDILEKTAVSLPMAERPHKRRQIARRYGFSYDELARTYFAVSPDEFHRYDDFLIGVTAMDQHPDCQLLWSALFNKNEHEYGRQAYILILNAMLQDFSRDFYPQRTMVTGHIDVQGGHAIISRQLRLASAKHAHPRESGQYLLLDLKQKVNRVEELLPGLGSVF